MFKVTFITSERAHCNAHQIMFKITLRIIQIAFKRTNFTQIASNLILDHNLFEEQFVGGPKDRKNHLAQTVRCGTINVKIFELPKERHSLKAK